MKCALIEPSSWHSRRWYCQRLQCLVFFDAPAWSACSVAAELSMSNTVAPPLSLVLMASRRWPRRLRRK
eukprot:1116890-Pleurochrysis_carterae.AAC.1